MEGKTVFQGKSDSGKEIIIRYPTKADLNAMWEFINALSKEKTFIRFQGEEISLEEEEKFLNSHLKKIAQKESVQLLVFFKGEIIGISDIVMKDKIEKHLGVFGIIIAKNFRGQGIGKILMEKVIDEARKNLPQLEIIKLNVFANNDLAKSMYKKFGFVEYGLLPHGIKLENGYADDVLMYKVVRNRL